MNLYKHVFEHYSQKDSESGTKKYFIAENDEEAYEKVYGKWGSSYASRVRDEYDDNCENEDYDPEDYEDTPETAKAKVLKSRGDLFLPEGETENMFQDLYYGLTLEGWILVQENVTSLEIDILKRLDIVKENK